MKIISYKVNKDNSIDIKSDAEFEDIRECKFVKEDDENKKYNIYKNTI